MGRRKYTRISPSGVEMELSWEGAEVATHVAGVHFAGGSFGRAFQISPLGAHDFAAQNLLDASLSSRLQVKGHEVCISTARDGSSTMATLISSHHELMTVFAGPAPEASTIAELFAVLDITDSRAGMQVTPQPATGLTVSGEHIVVTHEDSTSIDVPAPAHCREMIPRKAGRRTRHGEIWRNQLPGRTGETAHDFSYVVGTPGGVAEVVFAEQRAISHDAALAVLNSIDVNWS